HHPRAQWIPVTCHAPNCKLSPMHPASCRGAQCARTCYQGRQAPERAEPWYIQDFCSRCRAAGFSI
ncbi:hypothetical protein C8Q77DRAFT_1034155, partial [Trametes polyzona]